MQTASLPIEIWQLITDNLVHNRDYCSLLRVNKSLYRVLSTDKWRHKSQFALTIDEINSILYEIFDERLPYHRGQPCGRDKNIACRDSIIYRRAKRTLFSINYKKKIYVCLNCPKPEFYILGHTCFKCRHIYE